MDWSLIIFVAVVIIFAWRGFRSGFIRSLGRVCALLAGYGAAIGFAATLAPSVEAQTGIQGIAAFALASLGLFVGAGLVVMLIFALLRRFAFPGDDVSTASALGGSVVGALVGVLLAFVIVWSYAFARDMLMPAFAERIASAGASKVESLTGRLAGSAFSAAMEASSAPPEVARLGGALMASPADVSQRLQRLMTSAEFQGLLADPRNRRILDSGKVELVRQLPAFRALLANPDLQALARIAGFGEDGNLEADFARLLTDTWARAQRARTDPRVQEILADPEFRAALDSGNPVALLTDHQLLELADILFADEAAAPAGDSPAAPGGDGDATAEPAEIHQWTDSSGRVHYSDKAPAE